MGRANIRHGFPIKVVQIHDDCGCGVGGRGDGVRGADGRDAERTGTGRGWISAFDAGPYQPDACGREERVDRRTDPHDGAAARRGDEERLRIQGTGAPDGQYRAEVERVSAGAEGRGLRCGRDAGAGCRGNSGEGFGAALGARPGDGGTDGVAGTGIWNDAEDCADGAWGKHGHSARRSDGGSGGGEQLERVARAAGEFREGEDPVFNHPFDKELAATGHGLDAYGNGVVYRAAGPIAGAALGAVAVLVRSVGGADYRLPHTGQTEYAPGAPKIPAAAVTAEDAEMLKVLTGQGPVTMHLTLTPQTLPDAESYNVIADWKGTEHPEQVVVVSGHLDSWDLGTGAIDDGAGVAVSMQAIQLMKELGIHPRRTVRVIAWMSEEEGSEGAAAYMKEHTAEMGNHVGAIESDLGADHPTGIFYAGKPELGRWLGRWRRCWMRMVRVRSRVLPRPARISRE